MTDDLDPATRAALAERNIEIMAAYQASPRYQAALKIADEVLSPALNSGGIPASVHPDIWIDMARGEIDEAASKDEEFNCAFLNVKGVPPVEILEAEFAVVTTGWVNRLLSGTNYVAEEQTAIPMDKPPDLSWIEARVFRIKKAAPR